MVDTTHKRIIDLLEVACKDSTVAALTGFSAADWSNYHVFKSTGAYIAARNRGRKIFIEIFRSNEDNIKEVTDASEIGGISNISWTIRIFSYKSSIKNQYTNETNLYEMAQTILKRIKVGEDKLLSGFSISSLQFTEIGYYVDLVVNTETSWAI